MSGAHGIWDTAASSGAGQFHSPVSNIATGQVVVGTTPTLIVAARTRRASVLLIQEGTVLVRLGDASVTAGNGVPLQGTQYAQIRVEGGAAVYGVVAAGTQNVSFMECF